MGWFPKIGVGVIILFQDCIFPSKPNHPSVFPSAEVKGAPTTALPSTWSLGLRRGRSNFVRLEGSHRERSSSLAPEDWDHAEIMANDGLSDVKLQERNRKSMVELFKTRQVQCTFFQMGCTLRQSNRLKILTEWKFSWGNQLYMLDSCCVFRRHVWLPDSGNSKLTGNPDVSSGKWSRHGEFSP